MDEEQEDVWKVGERPRRPSRLDREHFSERAASPLTDSEFSSTQEGGKRVIRHVQRMMLTENQLTEMFPELAHFKRVSGGSDMKVKLLPKGEPAKPDHVDQLDQVKRGECPALQGASHRGKKVSTSFRKKGILKHGIPSPADGVLSESDDERPSCKWDEEAEEAHIDAMRQLELKYKYNSLFIFSFLSSF